MFTRQRTAFHAALIGFLLLIGQFGALIHSVEHPFHKATQACQAYSVIEHSGNGLISDGVKLVVNRFRSVTLALPVSPVLAHISPVYFSRAPPALS